MKRITSIANWIASHELWLMILVTPLLLFPRPITPWVGLVLIAIIWTSRRLARGHFSLRTPLDLPILLLLAMALVGLTISIDRGLSYPRLWSLILGIAYYYAVANAVDVGRDAGRVAALLALLTIGVAGLSLIGSDWANARMVPLPAIYDRIPNLIRGIPGSGISMTGDLFNPRWVGITMGFLVPPSLAIALFGQGRRLRTLCALAALIGVGLLLLSQSIQGLLGLVAGILVLAIWRSRWSLLLIAIGGILVIAGFLLAGPQRVIEYLLSLDNPIGIAVVLRLDIYSRALAMIQNMPYTGIGLNTFPLIQGHFFPGYLLGPEPHAHNLYLQTALDFGLIGLFALIWLLTAWAVAAYQNYHRAESPLYQVLLVGLTAGITSYLAHGLIDSLMLGAKPSVAIWVMLGLGIQSFARAPRGQNKLMPSPIASHPNPLATTPNVILVLVILLTLDVSPTSLTTNLGLIYAHQGLYPARANGSPAEKMLEHAQSYLIKSYASDAHNVYVADELGRIYAWENENPLAIQTFSQRVKIDSFDPFQTYYPPANLLHKLRGEANGEDEYQQDLIRIYTYWMNRYPDHAEHYLRLALAWHEFQPDSPEAERIISTGLEAGAQPAELLKAHLEAIQP
jgi:putative inorganic carbon (HCO3(-)) transporter